MTATGQLTKDEIRVLRPGLQAKLAEEQEAEAAKLAGEEARRREAERLERQAVEEREAKSAYFDAVAESERRWQEWLKAETDVHEKAEAWCALHPVSGLRPDSRTKRTSRYMSVGLKALPGASAGRYGEIRLTNYFSEQGAPWLQGERRELGEKET